MIHDYHEALPGFSPSQILHDGCGECESRSNRISALDGQTFEEAWVRATRFQIYGVPDLSKAERPLLETLIAIQIQLERKGVPFGAKPWVTK